MNASTPGRRRGDDQDHARHTQECSKNLDVPRSSSVFRRCCLVAGTRYVLQLRCDLVSASELHRVANESESDMPPSGTQGVSLMRSRNAVFPTVCAASRALFACHLSCGVAYRPRPGTHAMSSRVVATPMAANAARTAVASPTAVTVTPARLHI